MTSLQRFLTRSSVILFFTLIVSACGGGGGGSEPAPTGLSYPAVPTQVVGQPMASITPTVSGSVSNYVVSPALPAGLSLNATSGAIGGTPTAAKAATTYTVTASNGGGSTSTTMSLTVNDVPPVVSYSGTPIALTKDIAASPITPTSTGGVVVTWSIAPALPAGLSFDTSDGRISGAPTELSPAATYVVTAQNSGGTTNANLTLSVLSPVLFELGHVDTVYVVRHSGTRVLTQDIVGHWALWDEQSAAKLAGGEVGNVGCSITPQSSCNAPPRVDLAGTTLVARTPEALELRSSSDGHLVSSIATTAAWWKLATDGSYVVAGDASGLKAWSSAGAVLISRSGDYSSANAFAAPAEIRVAGGAAGADVVETITLSSGASSAGPQFQGTFSSWFADGERFLTKNDRTVYVYSKSTAQLDSIVLARIPLALAGWGDWFWSCDSLGTGLNIYAVGASAAPAVSYSPCSSLSTKPSGSTIALGGSSSTLRIVDLSGASPSISTHATGNQLIVSFAASSPARWFAGTYWGATIAGDDSGGTPQFLGLGHVHNIVGGTGRFAVATARGTSYFNSTSRALEGEVAFSSSKVAMSTDGSLLAVMGSESLRIISLPSGTVLQTSPYRPDFTNPPAPVDLALSANGQVFGKISGFHRSSGYLHVTRETAQVGQETPIWSNNSGSRLYATEFLAMWLSPSGLRVAVADDPEVDGGATTIYEGAVSISTVNRWPAGWIDEDRLLVNHYTFQQFPYRVEHHGSSIVDSRGNFLSSPALPDIRKFQTVDANSIYAPALNSIFSLQTGQLVWSSESPNSGIGAVAGGSIVFVSGTTVRAEPRP